ncbi:MAG TPA: NUDIX hydrolase [Planococcus sp. (in: firmicutes)]|nr:NUDIX hydrolase [Planococcus sp. (in: firmicutes)]
MEMSNWQGATGICINEDNEVLMVLQNVDEGISKWTLPTGPREEGESLEESCVREFFEETGLESKVIRSITTKSGMYENFNISFEIHYFQIEITGGELKVPEGDELIIDIAWIALEELDEVELLTPDDIELIRSAGRPL